MLHPPIPPAGELQGPPFAPGCPLPGQEWLPPKPVDKGPPAEACRPTRPGPDARCTLPSPQNVVPSCAVFPGIQVLGCSCAHAHRW